MGRGGGGATSEGDSSAGGAATSGAGSGAGGTESGAASSEDGSRRGTISAVASAPASAGGEGASPSSAGPAGAAAAVGGWARVGGIDRTSKRADGRSTPSSPRASDISAVGPNQGTPR